MAILIVVILVLCLSCGVYIGAALLIAGVFAMEVFTSRPVGPAMATTVWSHISLWGLASLPLFVWMGEILCRTCISENLFNGLSPLLRRMPGGLIHVNVVGCTAFSAISGSSAATLLTVGKITMPELQRRGYPDDMLAGTLAGAGTLGLLIPPSITMIIYGIMVEESIARLFMAGLIPGLMLASFFVIYTIAWGTFSESGRATREPASSLSEKLRGLLELLPIAALILGVIGSIYTGIAAPTEAAVLGVLGALILAACQRSLSLHTIRETLMGTVRTTSMIILLLAGSAFITLAMGFTGLPRALAEWIGHMDLSATKLIIALMVMYMLLGCFLDGISMIILTLAVVEPLIRAAGIDLIWFGVFVVLVGEMALITPPIGFNLFLIQGLTGKDIGFIARAAAPMFLLMMIAVILLIAFPEIALWLPEYLTSKQ
jgi:C4-dicarboxylate transporter DctM subunit